MASDMHLKIEGIEGDSQDEGHAKEIDISSYSYGVNMLLSAPGSSGSATTEKASFTDFVVTKNLDMASSKLFVAIAQGQHFPTVTVSVERADGKGGKVKYMQYAMTDAVIASLSTSHGGSGLPMESLAFGYSKIELTYIQTDPATGDPQGNIAGGWDLALNKPV
jgi:type VI secretion system secreted protein Hcp